MKLHYLSLFLLSTIVSLSSCKNDSEEDLTSPAPSSIRGLFINEVVSSPSEGNDWIELYNSTDKEIDLNGLTIYDGGGIEKGFKFSGKKTIAAKSYLVIETYKENTDGPTFGLSSSGDHLTIIDASDNVIDEIAIPALGTDQAYARRGDGQDIWQVNNAASKGSANTTEKTPESETTVSLKDKLFINEVVSSPAEGNDWIELYKGYSIN